MSMRETYYTESHEWIAVEGDVATVGITGYAAQQLGDVVYVELPAPGKTLNAGAEAAVVESVKAASEVYAPVAGEVTEVNDALKADPAGVNADAEGNGWFFRLKLAEPAAVKKLMTLTQYTHFVEGQH
jgi:glycine cleavage system H protein